MKTTERQVGTTGITLALAMVLGSMLTQGVQAQDAPAGSGDQRGAVIAGAEQVMMPPNADQQIFEHKLQRFAGTYAIYSWLPEQDRASVYRASRDGASMKDIRELVISLRRTHY